MPESADRSTCRPVYCDVATHCADCRFGACEIARWRRCNHNVVPGEARVFQSNEISEQVRAVETTNYNMTMQYNMNRDSVSRILIDQNLRMM